MLTQPDFPKRLRNCELQAMNANKRLGNIINDYNAIMRELCNAYRIICDTKAKAVLSTMDLEELNANKEGKQPREIQMLRQRKPIENRRKSW